MSATKNKKEELIQRLAKDIIISPSKEFLEFCSSEIGIGSVNLIYRSYVQVHGRAIEELERQIQDAPVVLPADKALDMISYTRIIQTNNLSLEQIFEKQKELTAELEHTLGGLPIHEAVMQKQQDPDYFMVIIVPPEHYLLIFVRSALDNESKAMDGVNMAVTTVFPNSGLLRCE